MRIFQNERIGEMNSKPEKLKTTLRKMFSLKEDTASHEEIRNTIIILIPSLVLGYIMLQG